MAILPVNMGSMVSETTTIAGTHYQLHLGYGATLQTLIQDGKFVMCLSALNSLLKVHWWKVLGVRRRSPLVHTTVGQ